jgi:hypothetical protein
MSGRGTGDQAKVVDLQTELLRRLIGRKAEQRLDQIIDGRQIPDGRQRRSAADAAPAAASPPAGPGGFAGFARLYGPFTR